MVSPRRRRPAQEAAAIPQAGCEDGQKTAFPDQRRRKGRSRDWNHVCVLQQGGLPWTCGMERDSWPWTCFLHEKEAAQSCRLSVQTRVSWAIPRAQSRAHCALGADSWEPGVQECSGWGAGRAPPAPDGLPGFHLYPQGSLLLRAGSPSAQHVML